MVQHGNSEATVGLTVIRNITSQTSNSNQWQGDMFNGTTGTFEPVRMKLTSANELVVYDQSKMEILRLLRK